MNHDSYKTDHMLDQLIEHVRHEEVPPYPDPTLLTTARTTTIRSRFSARVTQTTRFMKRPIPITATAIAIAIGSGTILLNSPSHHGGSAAFAEVQQAIGSTVSVKFHMLRFTGDEPPTVTTTMWLGPDRLRVELPGGDLIIEDLRTQEQMTISHHDRSALIEPLYLSTNDVSARLNAMTDFLKKLRNLPSQATKKIGERTAAGRKMIDFSVNLDGAESRVTVDASTKLPIQIEVTHPSRPGTKSVREVTTDFVFDPVLDDSLFRIIPPAGYAISRHSRGDANPQDTAVLVTSPESGIGPVKFGATTDNALQALGQPNWRKDRYYADNLQPRPELKGKDIANAKYIVTELGYDSRGFRLTINNQTGLNSIYCFNSTSMGPNVREFLGKTREGIKLGATPDDLQKAYGEPEVKLTTDDYWYPKRGWHFFFRGGKLASYQFAPPDPALEVEVTNDGSFTIRRAKK